MELSRGHVKTGFEDVRRVFEENFADDGELGAGFAAYQDGECIISLQGGFADRSPSASTFLQCLSGKIALAVARCSSEWRFYRRAFPVKIMSNWLIVLVEFMKLLVVVFLPRAF